MTQKYEANLTLFSNSPYSHDAKKNFFFRFLGPGGGPKMGGTKNVTNPLLQVQGPPCDLLLARGNDRPILGLWNP